MKVRVNIVKFHQSEIVIKVLYSDCLGLFYLFLSTPINSLYLCNYKKIDQASIKKDLSL